MQVEAPLLDSVPDHALVSDFIMGIGTFLLAAEWLVSNARDCPV